ncbi:MAG: hypothetical protein LQ342_005910 [Letrouitia transgressa]|nr:MAG: hypothetical protein LQ342_005910 [Letrouitia transgressa]
MLVEKFDAFADEIPSELIGVYDVVHVAIFVLVVRNNDPGKMVRNLFRMLKPGGWIMWNELDFLHRRIVKSDPSLPTPHLFALLQFMKIWEDSLGPKGWIESLPDIFSRYGMEESRLERVRMPEAYAKYDNDKSLSTFEDFSHAVLDTREKGEGALLRELVDRAHEECYQIDCCTQVDMIVATAKKPG